MNQENNFEARIKAARTKCLILSAISAAATAAAWLATQGNDIQKPESPSLDVAMQYVAMLATGFGIWYGYKTYDKTASLLKEKESLQEKQDNYLKASKFRNMLIYLPIALDLALFMAVAHSPQYCLTAACAVCFAFGAIPAQSKFENDFFKEIFIDLPESEGQPDEG